MSAGHVSPEAQPEAPLEFAGQRELQGRAALLVRMAAVALPVLTILVAFTGWFDTMTRRAGHLVLTIPLVFLLYGSRERTRGRVTPVDWALCALGVAAFGWVILERERLLWRLVYVDPLSPADYVLGVAAVLLVLEATRRTLGWTLVWLNLAFIVYAYAGPLMPGILGHKGVAFPLLLEHLYLVPEGLFSQITGIMATYLMVFLTFGTVLRIAGGDAVFTGLAMAVSGRSAGGPAKAAEVGSSLMGMLSGSTIANVVTTGAVTIPLMKRVGYRPHEAAAIETAAGTGGALMPPVMGAGVFMMSELTGIPLVTILKYSILPAVIYYASLYSYVHVKARKHGMVALGETGAPTAGVVLRRGWHLLLPLLALVVLLALNYSPFFASSLCVVALVALSWVRPETRLTPPRLLLALEASTRGALILSATSASAALITGIINITGLMLNMTSALLAVTSGSLAVGLLLIALVSSIVGIGLPITSTYIIVATLGASALVELGATPLAAHLIIFWLAQTATVTPPVCMTAFVAAQIAGAPPMRTGFEAMRVSKALYFVPLLFAYSSILSGSFTRVLLDAASGTLAVALVPVVTEGWFRGPIGPAARGVAALAVASFLAAAFRDSLGHTMLWLAVGLGLVGLLALRRPQEPPAVVTSSVAAL
ncbi:MAG TPA: TRAP transporter fused permease subunit [Vicinamibacteria bacterium]|nr:TRAP transporter fused permease subunit [Vicinamibacteria bacterium]